VTEVYPDVTAAEVRHDLLELTEAVETIMDSIDALHARLQAVEAAATPVAGRPSQWSWRHADPARQAALWSQLRDFVEWINARYVVNSEHQLPGCWYRHPVAVEELTALMAAWQAIYHGPDQPREDMLAWHDRWLWPCLDRLPHRAGWTRCRAGDHQERTTWIRPTDQGFDTFVRTAVEQR
jgi:hypothetical protein